jgi:lactose/cellobiose-specific phosphotransferase system IIC component
VWLKKIFDKIETIQAVVSVRNGFVTITPIIMAGVMSLVLMNLPIAPYQTFLQSGFGAIVMRFLTVIYSATFDKLAVYLSIAISMHYIKNKHNKDMPLTAPITALICFFILNNFNLTSDYLGIRGVFTAIVVALLSSKILMVVFSAVNKRQHNLFESGDMMFNRSVALIVPIAVTVLFFALINVIVVGQAGVDSFMDLMGELANAIFAHLEPSFASAFVMVFSIDFLWCFGIHGSNLLAPALQRVFNESGFAMLTAQPEILTRQFMEVFVLIGGCGASISLLIAVWCFSKRKSMRRVAWYTAIPMLFNVNELMVFGLPVVFNITLVIPFIIVPLVLLVISYAAIALGIVPPAVYDVNWTTPVIVSGFLATGSLKGSLLQLFNIAVGVAVYRPFVIKYDKHLESASIGIYDKLVKILQNAEESVTPVVLTELEGRLGVTARNISNDLRSAMTNNQIMMYYQPQYNNNGEYTGAEALLRWKHPVYGMIYPPLVIKLAAENGFLDDLEEYVLNSAVDGAKRIFEETGIRREIGINVSATTIRSDRFLKLVQNMITKGAIKPGDVCIEITEQTALLSDTGTEVFDRLKFIKSMGCSLAIDDFSMGHTSIKYLQDNQFDVVKLDGAIVKSMQMNERNFDIVKSIMGLSDALGFEVIAEYVENETQVDMLSKVGCHRYQGWLFSPAIPMDELIEKLKDEFDNGFDVGKAGEVTVL